jgi:hypothetical protein
LAPEKQNAAELCRIRKHDFPERNIAYGQQDFKENLSPSCLERGFGAMGRGIAQRGRGCPLERGLPQPAEDDT